MAVTPLTLIANPGSASRKYALFEGQTLRASIHFEYVNNNIACTIQNQANTTQIPTNITRLSDIPSQLISFLHTHKIIDRSESIHTIGIRVVAPGSYFLENRQVDDTFIIQMEASLPNAPLHIAATLDEVRIFRTALPNTPIIGISDSAFQSTKPEHAWLYGLPSRDAGRLDIKRYGYHGLSVSSVVHTLKSIGKLPTKVIVCHLGSGASVSAVHAGKAIDTTMGYSPVEGLVMATRSGSVDSTALHVLKADLKFTDTQLDMYLNTQSGLLGLSGSSSDIRELLVHEEQGDHPAQLALQTYVYSVQKAIGQMTAALGGIDSLIFTGTVGERSSSMRERILRPFHYLDLFLDTTINTECTAPQKPTCISHLSHSRPIYVVPTGELHEILRQTTAYRAPQ